MDQSDFYQYSRPATPSRASRQLQTSSPKPVTALPAKTVSLAEWEANTPLNQVELASLTILKDACSSRPLPAQVCGFTVHTVDVDTHRVSWFHRS
jgi:hypothetical protein